MVATIVGFSVLVVDGECIPVPGLEVGARYKYQVGPSTWSLETTDGDGMARFVDEHAEPPVEVDLYVGDTLCGQYVPEDGAELTVEV